MNTTLLKKGSVDVPYALPGGVKPRRPRAAWTVLVNQVQDRAHYNNGCCQAGPRLQAKLVRLKACVYHVRENRSKITELTEKAVKHAPFDKHSTNK